MSNADNTKGQSECPSGEHVEIARVIDGEPMIGPEGMALIFGVTADEAKQLRLDRGTTHLPADWVKRGQRRAREAKRWGGSDAMLDGLAYWAEKDRGAQLVEDSDGTVWMVGA